MMKTLPAYSSMRLSFSVDASLSQVLSFPCCSMIFSTKFSEQKISSGMSGSSAKKFSKVISLTFAVSMKCSICESNTSKPSLAKYYASKPTSCLNAVAVNPTTNLSLGILIKFSSKILLSASSRITNIFAVTLQFFSCH